MAGNKKEKEKPDNGEIAKPAVLNNEIIDEAVLFENITAIIESRKYRTYAHANHENTMMFWEVGQYINSTVLGNKRAAYGKQVLTMLSAKLVAKYGKSFVERNIYRMTLFAERFSDIEILPPLAAKLSWSHFIELLSLKSDDALKHLYLNLGMVSHLWNGRRE